MLTIKNLFSPSLSPAYVRQIDRHRKRYLSANYVCQQKQKINDFMTMFDLNDLSFKTKQKV